MTENNNRQTPTSQEQTDPRRPEADLTIEETAFLEPRIQEELGRVFRSFCDDLIHQPIPDKFVVLLAQLEAKQREKK